MKGKTFFKITYFCVKQIFHTEKITIDQSIAEANFTESYVLLILLYTLTYI